MGTDTTTILLAMHTTGNLIGVLILVLDLFAIVSVLMGTSPVGRKLLWIVVILLLPLVGMLLYFLIGRSSADAKL